MIATEQLSDLRKWSSEAVRKTGEGVRLNRAVELISGMFGVTSHEVAILGITADGRFLKFLAPQALRAVGQIPLSSGSALAVRTVREMKPEIVNHFYAVPHASVFEGVPVSESERGEPIQKIMSSPIMAGGKAIGVVQVSRKGKSTNEAGADFTSQQLTTLKTISDLLAPSLPLAMTE
jgi:GAF domain-containing protein